MGKEIEVFTPATYQKKEAMQTYKVTQSGIFSDKTLLLWMGFCRAVTFLAQSLKAA